MTDQSVHPSTRKSKSRRPNYVWVKLWIDLLDNPTFGHLSAGAVGAYARLLMLAGRADAGGLLAAGGQVLSGDDLAWMLRCQPSELDLYLDELAAAGFIARDGAGYQIVDFLETQGPGDEVERAAWRERQAKHRHEAKGMVTEKNQEPEQESEEIQRKEKEEEGESHGDVMVTSPVTDQLHSPKTFSQENHQQNNDPPALAAWKKLVSPLPFAQDEAEIVRVLGNNPEEDALAAAVRCWGQKAAAQKWGERYGPGVLTQYAEIICQPNFVGQHTCRYQVDLDRRVTIWSDGVEMPIDEHGYTLDRRNPHLERFGIVPEPLRVLSGFIRNNQTDWVIEKSHGYDEDLRIGTK